MKLKVSQKQILNNKVIMKVPYCTLQHLLDDIAPYAYSCGVYGWNCDYYDVGHEVTISTGYRNVGKSMPYKILNNYNKQSQELRRGKSFEAGKVINMALREQLVKEFLKLHDMRG